MGGRVRVAASADCWGLSPVRQPLSRAWGCTVESAHMVPGRTARAKGPEVALHTQVALPEACGKCFILKAMMCDNT